MWIKYSYVCTDCDALIEITTIQKLYDYRGWCACGSANLVRVAIEDSTVKDEYETNIKLP
jgi:DNA-directed RNA polymerase subunit RPC12/RpoP